MSEDIGAAGASALVTGHMSDRMSSRIALVGGRRRWSVDQKLAILREAFGPDGSVSATCQRHAVGSGMALYVAPAGTDGRSDGSEAHAGAIFSPRRGVRAAHDNGTPCHTRDNARVRRAEPSRQRAHLRDPHRAE